MEEGGENSTRNLGRFSGDREKERAVNREWKKQNKKNRQASFALGCFTNFLKDLNVTLQGTATVARCAGKRAAFFDLSALVPF